MPEPEAPEKKQISRPEDIAEKTLSSEKREDIWALIVTMVILGLCVAFPDQIHYLFRDTLYLF